jgi:hypothetical protein
MFKRTDEASKDVDTAEYLQNNTGNNLIRWAKAVDIYLMNSNFVR